MIIEQPFVGYVFPPPVGQRSLRDLARQCENLATALPRLEHRSAMLRLTIRNSRLIATL